MGTVSDFLENKILDHIWGATTYTPPATVYLALFTVAPDDAGAGGTEVTGGSYARKAVTNNTTNFPNAVAGAKTNGVDFDFVTATASWGTIVFVGVYDAVTAGNYLGGGAITSQAVASGNIFRVKAGDMSLSQA